MSELAGQGKRTTERLAAVLRQEGLLGLAGEALLGRFDDFESSSPSPIVDLVRCLRSAGRDDLAQRAIAGEWDGTPEESKAWFEREGRHLL